MSTNQSFQVLQLLTILLTAEIRSVKLYVKLLKLIPELILGSFCLCGCFFTGFTQLIVHGLVYTAEGIRHLKGNCAIELRLHSLLRRTDCVDLLLLPLHVHVHLSLHRCKGAIDFVEVCA